jgi:hypothetical protein
MVPELLLPPGPDLWDLKQKNHGDLKGVPRDGFVCGAGLTKTEAEELLDWLEAQGHPRCCLSYAHVSGFHVTG